MLPVAWGLGLGAAWLGKKIYDAVKDDNSSSSSIYSDNSAQREQEARQAEEQTRQQAREARQFQQLQQTFHIELKDVCKEYLSKPTPVAQPNRAQLSEFYNCDIDDEASAKAALSDLLGSDIQLKNVSGKKAEHTAQLQTLNELERVIKAL